MVPDRILPVRPASTGQRSDVAADAEPVVEDAVAGPKATDDTDATDATDAKAAEAAEDADADDVEDADADEPVVAKPPMSPVRLAVIVGLVAVLALAGVVGWLGYRDQRHRHADDQRNLFLEVGRQGATNLTTIDFEHVDDDVKRILDSATGGFFDEFQQRAQPFAEVVKQVKSKSVGKVTEAGIEEQGPDPNAPTEAEVLVAVTVNTSVAGQPDQAPRAWRMRISVAKVGDDAKVSNVEFVP